MKAHLEAIRAKLAAGYPVDLFTPESGRTGQYASVEAPAWADDPDHELCPSAAFQTDVRIRAVNLRGDAVAQMLSAIRRKIEGPLTVPGRHAVLVWIRSEFIAIDDTVTDPTTSRHPAYGVDTYLLASQPTLETP